ncbi:MAG: amidohydrolase family protein [Novosphingobium sp.]|nr:amidohydrolase family protein [Novosphingobium sp.]
MATTAKNRPESEKPAFDASKPKAYKPLELLPDPPKSKRYYTVLSVDDHMVEPAHMFEGRMPAKFKDHAPRIVENVDGSESWVWEDKAYPQVALCAVVGRPKERWGWEATRIDATRQGCWDPKARIADMDIDGVQAQLNFPSFMPGLGGANFTTDTKDPELGQACVRAWNDWYFEEWYSPNPDRFIPSGLVYLGDPEAAAQEVRRNADRGFTAISFVGSPSQKGLPGLRGDHWDPMLRACEETETVICLHVGSDDWSASPPGSSLEIGAICFPLSAYRSTADWIWSGAPVRFPKLQIAMSEGGIAWVPMLMDRLAYVLDHSAANPDDQWQDAGIHPVEVLQRNFNFCSIEFGSGMELRDRIGVERIMVETDYPHADSSWPNTQETLREALQGVSAEDVRKMTWENASKLYRFDVAQEIIDSVDPLPE